MKKQELLKALKEEISGEDYKEHFSTDTPRHDVADPSERLINLLFAAEKLRKKFGNMSPEEIAEKLGVSGSKRALDLILDLKNNPFYK